MLPSKMRPTSSPARLTTGEPELPPMMSFVVTKSSGVDRSICARPSANRRRQLERRLVVEAGRPVEEPGKRRLVRGVACRSSDSRSLCRTTGAA